MQEFRLTKNLLAVALALGCAAAQAQTPPAQTPPVQQASASVAAPSSPPGNIVALPSKIAVIRLEQAVMATKEGSAAGAALKAKYAPKQAELEKRQAGIQTLKEQLQKGGATMSADTKDKLQRDIDGKIKSLQRDAQDANDDSQQDMGKIFNDVGEKMLQVIEPYAYQNGYAVVLDVSNQQTPVLWAAPSTNITADIIKLYDQAHPGIVPAAAAPKPVQALPRQLPAPSQIKK